MVDASNFQKLELFRDPNNNDVFVARDPSDGSTFAVPFDSIEANSLSVNGTSFDEKADLTGTNGVLKSTQVPDLSITSIDTVANQTERLALDAEEGDVAIQTDVNKTFLLTTNDPTVDSNWSEVQLDVTGAISGQTITPSQTGTSTNRTDIVANTVDANNVTGAVQGCRVFLSSDQSISLDDNVKIQFDSEVYDSGNNFNQSSHNWTCPKTGLYAVNLQCAFSGGGSDQERQVLIASATNPDPKNEGAFNEQNSSDIADRISVSTINKYSSGDTIAGYVTNADSTDKVDSGSGVFRTFMEVAFLGGL